MAVERYGSKTDLVVKLILVFCVSMLSFAIGTLVGKKFSDNQHRIGQLDPSTPEKSEVAEGSTPENSTEAAEPAAKSEKVVKTEKTKTAGVSDKEISKLAEEFVDDEKPTRSVAAVDEEEKPSAEKDSSDANDEKAETKEEPKKAKAEKPSAMKVSLKKAEKPSAAAMEAGADKGDLSKEVKTSATGKYTVQVASYAKEEEAEGMTADLKNKGFSAFYVTAQVKGQKWFRVSVGLFSTQKEAQAYRSDLLARAKVSSAIVQKIN